MVHSLKSTSQSNQMTQLIGSHNVSKTISSKRRLMNHDGTVNSQTMQSTFWARELRINKGTGFWQFKKSRLEFHDTCTLLHLGKDAKRLHQEATTLRGSPPNSDVTRNRPMPCNEGPSFQQGRHTGIASTNSAKRQSSAISQEKRYLQELHKVHKTQDSASGFRLQVVQDYGLRAGGLEFRGSSTAAKTADMNSICHGLSSNFLTRSSAHSSPRAPPTFSGGARSSWSDMAVHSRKLET